MSNGSVLPMLADRIFWVLKVNTVTRESSFPVRKLTSTLEQDMDACREGFVVPYGLPFGHAVNLGRSRFDNTEMEGLFGSWA